MDTSLLCIALLALLLFALGFGVSLQRGRTEALIGYPPDPDDALHKWVRAHANAAEYVPILALLIWIAGRGDPGTWTVALMITVTAARFLHAIGMIAFGSLDKANPARFLGALGTYLGGAALAVGVLMTAL